MHNPQSGVISSATTPESNLESTAKQIQSHSRAAAESEIELLKQVGDGTIEIPGVQKGSVNLEDIKSALAFRQQIISDAISSMKSAPNGAEQKPTDLSGLRKRYQGDSLHSGRSLRARRAASNIDTNDRHRVPNIVNSAIIHLDRIRRDQARSQNEIDEYRARFMKHKVVKKEVIHSARNNSFEGNFAFLKGLRAHSLYWEKASYFSTNKELHRKISLTVSKILAKYRQGESGVLENPEDLAEAKYAYCIYRGLIKKDSNFRKALERFERYRSETNQTAKNALLEEANELFDVASGAKPSNEPEPPAFAPVAPIATAFQTPHPPSAMGNSQQGQSSPPIPGVQRGSRVAELAAQFNRGPVLNGH
jgi:hypothetical protein